MVAQKALPQEIGMVAIGERIYLEKEGFDECPSYSGTGQFRENKFDMLQCKRIKQYFLWKYTIHWFKKSSMKNTGAIKILQI